MKTFFTSKRLFLFAFLVLVIANIAVFAAVSANRSGEASSRIVLTERELQLPYRNLKEDSGMSLNIAWRTLDANYTGTSYGGGWATPEWLNEKKMAELGFDPARLCTNADIRKRPPAFSKVAFLVLEYGGAPYDEALHRADTALAIAKNEAAKYPGKNDVTNALEMAEHETQRERIADSRLFAIDAGLDTAILRQKYHDRSRYILVKAQIEPIISLCNEKEDREGRITKLSITSVHVPLQFKKSIDAATMGEKRNWNESKPPRYEVTLAYGKNYEPWIESVRILDAKN